MAVKIEVYVDDGNVYSYQVPDEWKGREHASAIIKTGYRSTSEKDQLVLNWFPPHRILKVKLILDSPSKTKYLDKSSAT